jgi:putative sigma-54 modulation protein
MKIIVNGRNIELTKAIKDYVTEKLSRLDHHFDFVQEVHVFLSVDKNPSIHDNQHAEATVHVPGAVIRVETSKDSLYASIDTLIDKINRSLRKHKTKLLQRVKHGNHGESIRFPSEPVAEEPHLDEEDIDQVFLTYEEEAEIISR